MREAIIADSGGELERLHAVVTQLASEGQGPAELLDLVRLAYNRSPLDGSTFVNALATGGLDVPSRAKQLIATLAMLVLIDKFDNIDHVQDDDVALANSIAAVAVCVLEGSGLSAVHGDLVSYASTWRTKRADRIRGGLSDLQPLKSWSRLKAQVPVPAEQPVELQEGSQPTDPAVPEPTPDPPIEPSDQEHLQSLLDATEALSTGLVRLEIDRHLKSVHEQLGFLWWMRSDVKTSDLNECVVNSCTELASICQFLPGPPDPRGLLASRLSERAEEPVDLVIIGEMRIGSPPDLVIDICPLLSGNNWLALPRVSAIRAAEMVYSQLELCGLVAQGRME